MREIVVIQLGQCGNQIGTKFWETICDEHGIDKTGKFVGVSKIQKDRLNVYFQQGAGKQYVPRTVMADLDKESIETARRTLYGRIFNPENCVYGQKGAGNNWAAGRYTEGKQLSIQLMEVIRRAVESSNCLQGFQVIQGLGGGTGSGLGTLIMMKLKEEYPEKILSTFSVLPSAKVSNAVVEPYNCLLSLNHLIETSDQTFCVDNAALHRICHETLQLKYPTYNDMNHLVACVVSGVTTCFRFPGQLNSDLRKLLTNMVPFPRLHFFVTGYVPLTARGVAVYRDFSVQSLVQQMFTPSNMMVDCNTANGKYMTTAAIFRGRISTKEVDDQMIKLLQNNASNFVEWIPNNIKTAVCDIAPRGSSMSATFIGNSTSIQEPLRRIRQDVQAMLKKRAYLHWYTGEGMEVSEFDQASSNLLELITEYQTYAINDETITELDMNLGDFVEEEISLGSKD